MRINIDLPPEIVERLDIISSKEMRVRKRLIEYMITKFVENYPDKAEFLSAIQKDNDTKGN